MAQKEYRAVNRLHVARKSGVVVIPAGAIAADLTEAEVRDFLAMDAIAPVKEVREERVETADKPAPKAKKAKAKAKAKDVETDDDGLE